MDDARPRAPIFVLAQMPGDESLCSTSVTDGFVSWSAPTETLNRHSLTQHVMTQHVMNPHSMNTATERDALRANIISCSRVCR